MGPITDPLALTLTLSPYSCIPSLWLCPCTLVHPHHITATLHSLTHSLINKILPSFPFPVHCLHPIPLLVLTDGFERKVHNPELSRGEGVCSNKLYGGVKTTGVSLASHLSSLPLFTAALHEYSQLYTTTTYRQHYKSNLQSFPVRFYQCLHINQQQQVSNNNNNNINQHLWVTTIEQKQLHLWSALVNSIVKNLLPFVRMIEMDRKDTFRLAPQLYFTLLYNKGSREGKHKHRNTLV